MSKNSGVTFAVYSFVVAYSNNNPLVPLLHKFTTKQSLNLEGKDNEVFYSQSMLKTIQKELFKPFRVQTIHS